MRTQEAFTIPLLECARRLNLRFRRTWVNGEGLTEHIFHCPLREDKNPSIYINDTKNVWYDNGGIISGGGIVQFINYIYQSSHLNDTKAALRILDELFPEYRKASDKNTPFFLRAPSHEKKPSVAREKKVSAPIFEVVHVRALYSYPLKNYLANERKISLELCSEYVREVSYRHIETGRVYYAIGFKSGDTWAVRRGLGNKGKGFKAFLGRGTDITIFNHQSSKILIFEGFIDFLSYLTIKKQKIPAFTCIVLNSNVHIKKALAYISAQQGITNIEYFRDRDDAGLASFQKLKESLDASVTLHDKSKIYQGYNDLNEWLTSQPHMSRV